MEDKEISIEDAQLRAINTFKAGNIDLSAVSYYLGFIKELREMEHPEDNNLKSYLRAKFERIFGEVYAGSHEDKVLRKIDFTDGKTAREAISKYVEQVAYRCREDECYTLTDVVDCDIVDELYAKFTEFNPEYDLDAFVLDYMADSGVNTGRQRERGMAEYLEDFDNDPDDFDSEM